MASREERVRLGQRAKQIVEDEVYQAAWAAFEATVINRWIATDPKDTETRESLYHQLHGARAAHKALTTQMQRGSVEAVKIESDERRSGDERGSAVT